jgi:S-adenosyl-L-methionine hydrolase (adenosine-forming)
MQLVSLITDYGRKDYYLAELKAALYTKCKDLVMIDISHEIPVYDISLAAYHLRYMLSTLPKNSINIASVHNFYCPEPKYIVFQHEDLYFIGPDNGLFSLVFEDIDINYFYIDLDVLQDRSLHNIYAHATACIHHGLPLEEFAKPLDEISTRFNFRPVVTKDQIKATIIHIDQFENVVTNCTKDIFEKSRGNRSFSIYYKPNNPIVTISNHYGELPMGEVLARFNSAFFLEIAINLGNACSTLHLFKNETIQIDFH